ncbi:unnamed protein product [Pieris macdunnoughi]|uniref:Uncharacterized protein n=1 Tax=Pieris macdunnoughi TaxID=345717 RepID=A0A821U9B0_9NEOP|nr:unnamed protein product [Pieris macdunnoughi]
MDSFTKFIKSVLPPAEPRTASSLVEARVYQKPTNQLPPSRDSSPPGTPPGSPKPKKKTNENEEEKDK